MYNTLKISGGVIAMLAIIDVTGFAVWIFSGQMPTDNFYIGSMTAHVLRAIIY